mmetsp:Transcript_16070/g.14035  ORF Transcript_16070/g.14035 Transcript_16070/m.14035 type:complete len:111 (-) Transcript_16070:40-372(-)
MINKSDSFLTSNISMGNTPEKINVPDFPQMRDKIANREISDFKTPTTIGSTKIMKPQRKKIKNQAKKSQFLNENKENIPFKGWPKTSKEFANKMRHHFFDVANASSNTKI